MTDLSFRLGDWWLTFRNKIDVLMMPVLVVCAIVIGGISLFSGIHILNQPFLVHIFEFLFTLVMNMILLFGIMKDPVENDNGSIAALPVLVASLVFAVFTIGLRLIPQFNMKTPWYVSMEISSRYLSLEFPQIHATWADLGVLIVSTFGSIIVQFLAFWAVSRAKFENIIWPYVTYVFSIFFLEWIFNFFLYLANYMTKAQVYGH